jgi:HK97 family phage portal protein
VSRLGSRLRNRTPVPMAPKNPGKTDFFNIITGRGASTEEKMRRGMEQYGEVGTLYGIVSRLSESCGLIDWHLYRKATDGRRVYREVETRTEVQKHAFLSLMEQPNALMDFCEFVETSVQHYDTAGEFVWVVAFGSIRAAGPMQVWPVRPDRMRVVTSDTEALTGYVYVSPDGERVPLLKEQVIHIRRPNPLDPYRGLGPVQSLGVKLDSNRLAAEYARNFFHNSAEPGGIIEIEDRLDDDEFRELVSRWREQHQGVANAHRVAVLEQGKWVERKYSMRDMHFPELAELSREDIREAFGYPKGMTGATEDVNKAVADANERMFGRYLLRPRLKKVQAGFRMLLKLFGDTAANLEFDYEDPVPEDREADSADRITKAQALKMFVEAGMDWKGALEVVGLPEVKQDEMKLQMAREAHELAMNPPQADPNAAGREAPGGGRQSQSGGDPKPNQEPAKPSPARETNNERSSGS